MLDLVKQLDDICKTTIKMLLNDEYKWYYVQVSELYLLFFDILDREVERINNLPIVEIDGI